MTQTPPEIHDDTPLQGLDDYLSLFAPYEAQLRDFSGREREYGGRFALLFRQIARLLIQDTPINQLMPKMYPTMAQNYLAREKDAVRHFSYEDNRHFFLSELREWLEKRNRGRRMQRLNAGQ